MMHRVVCVSVKLGVAALIAIAGSFACGSAYADSEARVHSKHGSSEPLNKLKEERILLRPLKSTDGVRVYEIVPSDNAKALPSSANERSDSPELEDRDLRHSKTRPKSDVWR